MNKLILLGGILLLGIASVDARDISIRPRFNVGVMSYEYTLQAKAESPAEPLADGGRVFPTATSEWSANFELPLVRTGLTLFVDRVFFDFDFQYAFNGNDEIRFSNWSPLKQGTFPGLTTDHFARFDSQADLDFERTEFAMTLGYALTNHLAVYAGYKRAESDMDFDVNGKILAVQTSDLSENRSITGFSTQLKQKLIYDGPFLGATYTWNINQPILEGALTGNIGVALLDGRSNNQGFKNFNFSGSGGETIPVDVSTIDRPPFNLAKLDGDTTGLTLALTWNGFTPIDGLTYSVGLNGYRYEFDGNNSQNFTIDILRFDTGISYTFGL